MAIKKPAETAAIVNPLHRYASYTYSWSLWWLDPKDYNTLMKSMSVEEALNWKPTSNKSFVIAEDGGRYPKNRQPGTKGLNYHIQNVQFETLISPNKKSKSSNMLFGEMTIIEPYGITLIDTLVAASFDGTTFNNYTDNPYMLQLEFVGYDDNGDPIPKGGDDIAIYNKRFPIKILSMEFDVTTKGAQYKIEYIPTGGEVLQSSDYSVTPRQFDITAGTVEAFFNGPDGLAEQWEAWWRKQEEKKQSILSDGMFFKIDPEIAKSEIVNKTKVSLAKANPKAKNIDLKNSTFSIPKGTPVLDIITRVMAHSSFLIEKQLGLEATLYENSDLFDPTQVFNAFKTTTKLEYGGIDRGGQRQDPAIDIITNRYPKIVTFNIQQYSIWNTNHPATPRLTNSYPHTTKYYNYMYTGLNTDITDIKINFDSTYYTAILGYTSVKAAEDSTDDTGSEISNNNTGKKVSLNTAILTKMIPQLASIATVTQPKYKFIVDDVNITSGMNIKDRPAAQVSADVLKSIYTAQSQEMLAIDLGIVGDPTLLKQDDWLYVPDPESESDSTDWSISNAEYTQRYGHSPMDRGQIVVRLIINSPVDMDLDHEDGDQGLAYPQPKYTQSLFSGQYIILGITNKFANGVFSQTLNLSRIMGDEFQTAFELARNGDGRNPVELGTRIDKELAQTNPSQPAGDEGDNTPLPLLDMSAEDRAAAVANAQNQPWSVQVNGNARE
jgi:hypothetical protein